MAALRPHHDDARLGRIGKAEIRPESQPTGLVVDEVAGGMDFVGRIRHGVKIEGLAIALLGVLEHLPWSREIDHRRARTHDEGDWYPTAEFDVGRRLAGISAGGRPTSNGSNCRDPDHAAGGEHSPSVQFLIDHDAPPGFENCEVPWPASRSKSDGAEGRML